MYYIEKNEKEVVKYEVILHENGINEVRDRLIKAFSSKIKINNFMYLSAVTKLETDKIKDFINNNDRISFNYYIYPELVILIDMLICGNISVLKKIINYNQTKINYKDLINENHLIKISNDISNQLDIDFSYNDLLFYLNKSNLQINNEDYMFLKDELLKCISFKKIDSVNLKEFYKVLEFLNINTHDVLNNNSKKVKSKINK